MLLFSSVWPERSIEEQIKGGIMEKLLTLQEVSQILGSTDPKGRQARELWKKGYLNAAKIGRRLMFTETSVREYINYQIRSQN